METIEKSGSKYKTIAKIYNGKNLLDINNKKNKSNFLLKLEILENDAYMTELHDDTLYDDITGDVRYYADNKTPMRSTDKYLVKKSDNKQQKFLYDEYGNIRYYPNNKTPMLEGDLCIVKRFKQ